MPPFSLISPSTLHQQAAHWFNRASASVLGAIPCRRGCSACCVGPFLITVIDAEILNKGLPSLDPGVQKDIQDEARRHVAAFEEAFPRLADSPFVDEWPDAELDAITAHFGHLPCPALASDGSCRVYGFRPVTCRTMGIPQVSEGVVNGACEVQTSVPMVRVSRAIGDEANELAEQEAAALLSRAAPVAGGDELLLPYGFLEDPVSGQV